MPSSAVTKKGVRQLSLEDNAIAARLFGRGGGNLKRIEKDLDVSIGTRGTQVTIQGDEERIGAAGHLIEGLYSPCQGGIPAPPFRY